MNIRLTVVTTTAAAELLRPAPIVRSADLQNASGQGANSHQGRFFFPTLSDAGYLPTALGVSAASGKPVDQIVANYPLGAHPNQFEAASAVLGDAAFACTAPGSTQLLARVTPTYAYEFGHAASRPLGPVHSAELK